MPNTAQAAVFHQAGELLRIVPVELPRIGPGELLVAIDCCTLCGSDLHTIRGHRVAPTPSILGHEILGRVVSVNDDEGPVVDIGGQALQQGDRISWSLVVSCQECENCLRGLPQKCATLFKFGHEPWSRWPLSGGLAEYCHLPRKTSIVKIPSVLDDAVACPVNCATATVTAAFRAAGDIAGKSVLIQGAGMLGLTATALAAHSQASHVIVTDISPQRLSLASQFGATKTIDVRKHAPAWPTLALKASGGQGVDVALEMSGAPAAIDAGLKLLNVGGRLVLVGSVMPTPAVSIEPERVVRRLLRIEGVHNYRPDDLATAVQFLEATAHRFPWKSLVPERFPLSRVNEAVARAMQGDAVRVAVVPRNL